MIVCTQEWGGDSIQFHTPAPTRVLKDPSIPLARTAPLRVKKILLKSQNTVKDCQKMESFFNTPVQTSPQHGIDLAPMRCLSQAMRYRLDVHL